MEQYFSLRFVESEPCTADRYVGILMPAANQLAACSQAALASLALEVLSELLLHGALLFSGQLRVLFGYVVVCHIVELVVAKLVVGKRAEAVCGLPHWQRGHPCIKHQRELLHMGLARSARSVCEQGQQGDAKCLPSFVMNPGENGNINNYL